jgi:hypothetical protein
LFAENSHQRCSYEVGEEAKMLRKVWQVPLIGKKKKKGNVSSASSSALI